MKRKDVSVLCFDIETTGLHHNESAKVLLIANTYRKGDVVINKLFSLDDYSSQRDFFDAWCKWVRELNPAILATYNGFAFDIPYMMYCATRAGASLNIGRDNSALELEMYEAKFRQDQSRTISYRMPKCWGREMVDLFFVVQKWDIGKKFSRYSLKTIIKEAGLERSDRAMVDAAQIWKYWDRRHSEPEVWQKVKDYAEHDGMDTLAVYDMVGDAYFYSTALIPFTFERMCLSSSGAQLNAIMLRHYISNGKAVAKASEKEKYQGAISFGNAGIYSNVFKIDVASLYPSVIQSFELYDRDKDPDGIYLFMNNYFREARLKYKKLAKETGEEYYAAMDAVFKALVNSVYGAAGASGCNYNAPAIAAKVTEEGRNILMQSIAWAESRGFQVVNGDTDSISFVVPEVGEDYLKGLLKEVNGIMRTGIRFEDDGFFPKFVILKAKNYIMLTPEGKIKLKGSALKSSKMEKGLKDYQGRCIRSLLSLSDESLQDAYLETCRGLAGLKSMLPWASRKTISEKTVSSTRKNEKSLIEALKGVSYQIGDKVDVYFTNDNKLKLVDQYDPENPDHNFRRLLTKVFNSSKVFNSVDTHADLKVNYGLSTKAKAYNDMVRAKVLPVKEKKPSIKNSLQELVILLTNQELICKDAYGADMVQVALETAVELLKPKEKVVKEKKPRKKKEVEVKNET
jgi:DNA polymerase elongation subunit (family B)